MIKSAFIVLQLLVDRELVGPAHCLIYDLTEFGKVLEKIRDLKQNYNADYIEFVVGSQDEKKPKSEGSNMNIDFYSVLIGAFLKSFATAPRNPCLKEYYFALSYFYARVKQLEGNIEEAEAALKDVKTKYEALIHKNNTDFK